MEQTVIMPVLFEGNYAYSITKIMNSTYAVGTNKGVYIIDIRNKDNIPTLMMKGYRVYSVKLMNNGNIICGTWGDGKWGGYYLLDIISK